MCHDVCRGVSCDRDCALGPVLLRIIFLGTASMIRFSSRREDVGPLQFCIEPRTGTELDSESLDMSAILVVWPLIVCVWDGQRRWPLSSWARKEFHMSEEQFHLG